MRLLRLWLSQCLVSFGYFLSPCYAGTPANWVAASGGSWFDASNWSISPDIPYNAPPPGAHYDVTLGDLGTPYSVAYAPAAALALPLDSLTLQSPSVTLAISNGTLSCGTVQVDQGMLMLGDDSAISGAVIQGNGGTILLNSMTSDVFLDSVTLRRTLDLEPGVFVQPRQTLTIDGNAGFRSSGNYGWIDQFQGLSIDGSGTLAVSKSLWLFDGGTTTIAANVRLESDTLLRRSFGHLVNHGTLSPLGPSILQIDRERFEGIDFSGSMSNRGVIESEPGAMVAIDPAGFTNEGELHCNGGSIVFYGYKPLPGQPTPTITPANLGQFNATTGTLGINCILNATGQSLHLNDNTGSIWIIESGYLQGGTVTTSGNSQVNIFRAYFGGGGHLAGTVMLNHTTGTLLNAITLNDGTIKLFSPANYLSEMYVRGAEGVPHYPGGSVSISGSGTVLFEGAGYHNLHIHGVATLGSNICINARDSGGTIGAIGNTMYNAGTIMSHAPGVELNVLSSLLYNTGHITSSNNRLNIRGLQNSGTVQVSSGTLNLYGTWYNSGLIDARGASVILGSELDLLHPTWLGNTLYDPGSVSVKGWMKNSFQTLALNDVTGAWALAGGTFEGGTLSTAGNGYLRVAANHFIKDVSLDGVVQIDGGVTATIEGGSYFQGGTVRFNSTTTGGTLMVGTDGYLAENGTIAFAGPARSFVTITGGTLNLDSGFQVRASTGGKGRVGAIGRPMLTSAYVLSEGPGADIWMLGSSVTLMNWGRCLARNGGKIRIEGSWKNNGIIEVDQGWLELVGSFNGTLSSGVWCVTNGGSVSLSTSITNNAAQIQLDGAASSFPALAGLRTNSGSLTISGGHRYAGAAGTTFTNTGSMSVDSLSAAKFVGALSNSGTIEVSGSLLLDYPTNSPLGLIRQQIQSGLIRSNAVSADPSLALAYAEFSELNISNYAGIDSDLTTLLLTLALHGDATMDGRVDTLDFNRLAAGFGRTNGTWRDGDFNYDAVVNSHDFNRFLLGYGRTFPVPLVAVVPEPLVCALLPLIFILPRRRSCQSRFVAV